MASQVFYRKFRSQTLAELVGQTHVTQTLLNALKNNNISHAYLFCGPRGTGKTSTARILAKAINCLTNQGRGEPCNTCAMCLAIMEDRAMDVIEIDAASNRGIDDIRDLREKVNYAPSQARRKVYIIDEFHMLSREASNALLKTLEEPPPHVVFILATTEAHKVLPTILSRCQHFDFHRLARVDVVSQLTKICKLENIVIEPQSLQLIARNTTGSMRDAENLLEQLATYHGSEVSFPQVQAMLGITGDARVKEIVQHIVSRDISAGMATLNSVNNDGLDLKQFNRELIEYLRNLLLVKTGAAESVDLTLEDIVELKDLAEKAPLTQILHTVKLFGQIEMGNTENTTLPLELALIETYLSQEKTETRVETSVPIIPPATRSATARPISSEPKPPVTGIAPTPAPIASLVEPKPAIKTTIKAPLPDVQVKQSSPVSEPQAAAPKPLPATPLAAEKKEEFVKPAPVIKESIPAAVAGSEIERLRANWQKMLEGYKTRTIAMMRSGKPITIENEVVVLSFSSPILRDLINKEENQNVAEKIISDFLGRPCQIRCVCESDNNHLTKSAIKLGAQVTSVEEK
jgi:DNA polymerase-3 subunit gamma/tau